MKISHSCILPFSSRCPNSIIINPRYAAPPQHSFNHPCKTLEVLYPQELFMFITNVHSLSHGTHHLFISLVVSSSPSTSHSANKIEHFHTYPGVFFVWKARILFGVDTPEGPPTPQTPLPVLPPRQRGYHSNPS
jgi:hypothetical protein